MKHELEESHFMSGNLHRNGHKTQNKDSLLEVYSGVLALYVFFVLNVEPVGTKTLYW